MQRLKMPCRWRLCSEREFFFLSNGSETKIKRVAVRHESNSLYQGLFKENLAQHIKYSDAVLKKQILVADGIDLPAFGEMG